MKLLTSVILGFVCFTFQESKDDMKKKAFYTLINSLINHSVEEVKADELIPANRIWLDARAKEEFDISRIEGAKFVGYDDFSIQSVEAIDKEAEIIVYCSIGYRSEKVAEKLEAAGFTNVKNLYGGIFDWHNSGMSVVDSSGNETNRVHGFGRTWGIWLNDAETVY